MKFRNVCLKIVFTKAAKHYWHITFKKFFTRVNSTFFFKLLSFACTETIYWVTIYTAILALMIGIVEYIVCGIFFVLTFAILVPFYNVDTILIPAMNSVNVTQSVLPTVSKIVFSSSWSAFV